MMKWPRHAAQILVALVLLLGPRATTLANDLDDAYAAYKRGDYRTAFHLFKPLAEQGDVWAQYSLGFQYATGQGIPQDYAEAAKWYRKAADQGLARAQNNLGVLYENGQGVPQDYADAVKWYRKAAEQGDALPQNNLGFMYAEGHGVPQDYVQAHMWFDLAAAQGLQEAINNRDFIAAYMTPADVTKAQQLAREWLAKHQQ